MSRKIKVKLTLQPAMKARGTLNMGGGVDWRHVPAALPKGMTQYTLYNRLGGAQGPSGRVLKISLPQQFNPRTAHPVASRKK